MRVTWLLLGIGGLLGLLCSVALTFFPMHPAEVESKAAAWLLYAGFSEWGEGLTETTDFWVSTALWIPFAIAIGLVCVALRMFRRDAVAVKQNLGNGWRVSRRMMSGLEAPMQEHGEESVTQAITALDEEFPPAWWRKRRMNHAAALEARMLRLERQRETESQPSPEQERLSAEEITGDGKEVAKMMLRAPDLDEVERLRTTYKRASHPEGRLFEHFVNKAYSYRLGKAGDRDKAQEFHDVVESNDKDSVRESLEFTFLVDEVEH